MKVERFGVFGIYGSSTLCIQIRAITSCACILLLTMLLNVMLSLLQRRFTVNVHCTLLLPLLQGGAP